jgi:hypothetical protein
MNMAEHGFPAFGRHDPGRLTQDGSWQVCWKRCVLFAHWPNRLTGPASRLFANRLRKQSACHGFSKAG